MLDGPSAVAHYQADRRDNSFVIIANESVVDALNELQAHALSGPILASVITASRDEAIHKALPIPAHIRRQLTGYASEDSMNRVRYKINNDSSFSLAYLLEHGGFADAVTLIDVVVFRDPRVAASPCAWAHELTHVDQFREWGVEGFAVRYARDWRTVESQAYAKGDGYDRWKHQQKEFPSLDVDHKCSLK
ncbi:DUF4157 domain-containing protein [Rhizobium sp. RHZ02]|nr:DUF4157 domain-containing protein [Rhizobium sp. RHZ01]MBD9454159.1 DUF4157 domain-containing protein [Rhizobium sp. RHZ02]